MEKQQGQLQRSLSTAAVVMLVISSVIGSGVYKKVAPMSAELFSPGWVLLAWVLGGLISLFGALSNAEIAGMMAGSGGEYVYFRRIYGRFVAFLWGWSTFAVIKTAAVASIAYVFSQSLNAIVKLPRLPEFIEQAGLRFNYNWSGEAHQFAFLPFENSGVKICTILLILGLTFLNTRGLKSAAGLSRGITYLVLSSLALIVISGLFFGGGSWTNIQTAATPVLAEGDTFDKWDLLKGLFTALLAAFWAYEGWNTIGFIGGEIKNPNRTLPLALFSGMMVIIGVYVLVNFTYLYVLPAEDMVKIAKGKNGIAAVEVIRHFAGNTGAILISIVIALTTLGCTNSTILMPPRVYQAMAEDGLFFKRARAIHPKFGTPNPALWMQGVWACLLVLSGSFDQLTDMLIFAAFFFYGATAFGVFVMRIREPNAERPYKVFGYPIIPAMFVLFCLTLIVVTCFSKPGEALAGSVLMLTGVPFYLWWTRRKV